MLHSDLNGAGLVRLIAGRADEEAVAIFQQIIRHLSLAHLIGSAIGAEH